jgi:structural maintenance of chromosome 2
LECLETDVATAEDAVSTAEKVLLDETNHESDLQMKVGEAQRLYEEAKQELDELSDRVTSCSTELAGLKNEHSSLAKEAESIKLETKKLSLAAANLKKERSASEKLVASMLKQHPWIETEKNSFGVLGGDYDFEANNPSKASKRLKQLQSEQESLVS